MDADWAEIVSSPNEEQSMVWRMVMNRVLRNAQHVIECSQQVPSTTVPLPEETWVRILVSGGPGTGKSWLLQVLADLVKVTTGAFNSVGLCGPTGSAASIINGEIFFFIFLWLKVEMILTLISPSPLQSVPSPSTGKILHFSQSRIVRLEAQM